MKSTKTVVTNTRAGFITMNYTGKMMVPVVGPNGPVMEGGKPKMQEASVSKTFHFVPGNNTLDTELWNNIRKAVPDDKWDAYYSRFLHPVCDTVEPSGEPTEEDINLMNVQNASIYISGIVDAAKLDEVEAVEAAGKGRVGVMNAIVECRQAIENAQAALDKDKKED